MTTIINEKDESEINALRDLMPLGVSDDMVIAMADVLFHSSYDDTDEIPQSIWEKMIDDAYEAACIHFDDEGAV